MYDKILVATDGSSLSKKAVSSAISLAALAGADLVALKVVPRYPQSYFEGGLALQAAEVLAGWGPSVVVIKKGEHGALMKVGAKFFVYPAFPLARIKDPTGAGDTFAGGFLGYLAASGAHGDVAHLKRAMAYGTTMASFNVQDFSTKNIEGLERDVIDERFHDLAERMTIPRADEFVKPRRAVAA